MAPTPLDYEPNLVDTLHYIPKRAVAEVFRINSTQRSVRHLLVAFVGRKLMNGP